MIEYKFSLELTRNGVQKSIHAKAGEGGSRKAVITLTESGKVFDASGYNLRVYFDDGTYSDNVSVVNGCIEFVLPSSLAGEKLCELRVKEKDDKFFFSPMFRILVEESIGSNAESVPIGKSVRYQEIIPNLPSTDIVSEDDEIAVDYDGITHRTKITNLPFSKSFENEEVLKKISEENGNLNFNGEEISLSSVRSFILTAVTWLSELDIGFVNVDSPEAASMPTSKFASLADALYGSGNELYFSPTHSGSLSFNDSISGEGKIMMVQKGIVYKFYVNYETFAIDYSEANSIEDVRILLGYINNFYAVKKDIPQKLSSFENDRGFVSKTTVTTMIDEAIDETNEPKLTMVEMMSDYDTGFVHDYVAKTITIECASLPINARVRRIEIPDVVNETDEYLNLEDMMVKDTVYRQNAPYIITYPKNMQGEYFTVAACVYFPSESNRFFDAVSGQLFFDKTIKIYYEIEE